MTQENSNISAREAWELRQALARQEVTPPDVEEQWEALNDSLNIEQSTLNIEHSTSSVEHSTSGIEDSLARTRMVSIVRWAIGVAAAVVVAIGLWQWSGSSITQPPSPNTQPYAFQATEGGQDVTLTADNGKPQVIDAHHPSTIIQHPSSNTHHLKLATPRGQDYHLTLPDGTEVWLNGESELHFPSRFGKGNREVSLRGEAYFAVAKDKAHPFIVHTEQMDTRVLGTSFNIRAYAKGATVITLVEGSVSVTQSSPPRGDKRGVTLKPGQQCSISNAQCSIKEVDTYPITQWKEGFFYFDNATMLEIMQELARWYNVNVAFDNPATTRVRLHFVAERSGSLAEAIRQLNALGEVEVELTDNVVSIR